MSASEFRRGVSWSLAAALWTGVFAIPWKLANEAGSAATSALLLLAIAALLNSLLVVGQRLRAPSRGLGRRDLQVSLVLAALSLFGNLASASAIQRLSPTLLNTVLRGDVIAVALLAWIFLGERVEKRFWLGVALAVGGLVILQGPVEEGGPANLEGTVFALGALLCFSSMAVVTRRVIHEIDPVAVNGLRLWASLPLWFVFHGVPAELWQISAEQLGYAGLAAFAGPFAGRLCLMISARYVEARVSTLGVLSAPAITLLLEFTVLGRIPPSHEWIGGAIMIAGIALPLLAPSSRNRNRNRSGRRGA